MGKLSVKEAKREYEAQLAAVEAQLAAATTRVATAEAELRIATVAVVRAGKGQRLDEDEACREARREVDVALSARATLDSRRAILRARLRAVEGA